MKDWKQGMKDGLPIMSGYFAVSFTFGIFAKQWGFNPFEAVFMSGTNLTSAGQFAGVTLIAASAAVIELIIAQIVINSRYLLMSFALSQRIDPDTPMLHRLLMAYGVTDEIFGAAVLQKRLTPAYIYGLMTVAVPGWVFGTLLGIVSGNILPDRAVSALSIALYAMLTAVIIPPAKGNSVLMPVIIISMFTSFMISHFFTFVTPGIKIILLSLVISALAAYFFPVKEGEEEQGGS